jgi:hypothetical protein
VDAAGVPEVVTGPGSAGGGTAWTVWSGPSIAGGSASTAIAWGGSVADGLGVAADVVTTTGSGSAGPDGDDVMAVTAADPDGSTTDPDAATDGIGAGAAGGGGEVDTTSGEAALGVDPSSSGRRVVGSVVERSVGAPAPAAGGTAPMTGSVAGGTHDTPNIDAAKAIK